MRKTSKTGGKSYKKSATGRSGTIHTNDRKIKFFTLLTKNTPATGVFFDFYVI